MPFKMGAKTGEIHHRNYWMAQTTQENNNASYGGKEKSFPDAPCMVYLPTFTP